jgi:hypothetical protein
LKKIDLKTRSYVINFSFENKLLSTQSVIQEE